MPVHQNAIDNSVLARLSAQAGPDVTKAVHTASARTGVDFSYLMEKAAAESSFNPDARAATSSARGLYQFIESTWLDMVKRHGDKYGLGDMAADIGPGGKVADPARRTEILEMRNDPAIAASMAAEFAAGNKAYLEKTLGPDHGDIGPTELYFAHFMGAGGASQFLQARQADPQSLGADLFPQAARANRPVFYDQSGTKRTLGEIYDFFDRKFSPATDDRPHQDATLVARADAPEATPAADDFTRSDLALPRPPVARITAESAAIEDDLIRSFVQKLGTITQDLRRQDSLSTGNQAAGTLYHLLSVQQAGQQARI